MTDRDIVFTPGTGEPNGHPDGHPAGMLWGVGHELNRIAPGHFRFHTVDYLKQYGNPNSYNTSRLDGERKTHAVIDRLAGARVVGFSMGATIAGNVADVRDDVPCAYLLADPMRPAGANSTGMPGQRGYVPQERFTGHGVGGQRKVGVARWYSIVGDVITDCYPDSIVRDIADVSEFMGFSSLDEAAQWARSIGDKITRKAWQNLPFYRKLITSPEALFGMPGLVKRSVEQGLGYPKVHCDYGNRMFLNHGHTYIQELARDIATDAGVLHP